MKKLGLLIFIVFTVSMVFGQKTTEQKLIEQYEKEIEELKADNGSLTSKVTNLENEKKDLDAKLVDCETERSAATDKNTKDEATISKLNQEKATLLSSKNSLETENQQLNKDLIDVKAKYNSKVAEYDESKDYKKQFNDLKRSKETVDESLKLKLEEINRLTTENESLKNISLTKDQDIQKLKEENTKCESDKLTLVNSNQTISKQVTAKDAEIQTLNGQIKEIKRINSGLLVEKQNLTAKQTKYLSRIKRLAADSLTFERSKNIISGKDNVIKTVKSDLEFAIETLVTGTNYSTKNVKDFLEKLSSNGSSYRKANVDVVQYRNKLNNFKKVCESIESSKQVLNKAFNNTQNSNAISKLKNCMALANKEQKVDVDKYLFLLENYKMNSDAANTAIGSAENFKSSSHSRAKLVLTEYLKSCHKEYTYLRRKVNSGL